MSPLFTSVLFVLVRCNNGVLVGYWAGWWGSRGVVLVWLRDVAGPVGEYEAVMPMRGSASVLYRT